jgi:hypothetical protein
VSESQGDISSGLEQTDPARTENMHGKQGSRAEFATAWIRRRYYQPCWYSDELEIVDTFQPHEHASELHDCYGLLAFAIEIRAVYLGLAILAQEAKVI